MAGGYDNPFFYEATGREDDGFLFDPFANEAELSGNPVLYRVSGFPGVPQGGIQIPIDLSSQVISPQLQAKFGGIPIWIWLVAIGVAVLFYLKKS